MLYDKVKADLSNITSPQVDTRLSKIMKFQIWFAPTDLVAAGSMLILALKKECLALRHLLLILLYLLKIPKTDLRPAQDKGLKGCRFHFEVPHSKCCSIFFILLNRATPGTKDGKKCQSINFGNRTCPDI